MPRGVTPPTFNRYDPGMTYGRHVDNPLMGAGRLGTDLSVTVFLSDLDSYDGGELCIESDLDVPRVRLPAGDAVIYPSGLVPGWSR
jgi:PKHD-type hydroxylase